MSKLLLDNYKHKRDRLALEAEIQQGGMRSDEIENHAEDVAPARSAFANFMERAGWGLLIALVALALFGRLIWTLWHAL